jgi:predicted MFS family arabinose efflux permease
MTNPYPPEGAAMASEISLLTEFQIGLAIAGAEFAVGVLGCYCLMIVEFFRRRETALAILCVGCLLLCIIGLPLGVPVAIIFGWMRARRWSMQPFMALWTGLLVVMLLNFAGFFALEAVYSSRHS